MSEMNEQEWRKERARLTQLAVEVVTLWHQEGGPTKPVDDAIRRIIDEEGDVGPLLIGIFNVATESLSMLAELTGKPFNHWTAAFGVRAAQDADE